MVRTTFKSGVKAAFMLGVMASSGLSITIQDYMGRDRYIDHLHGAWVSLPWPIGAIAFIMAIALLGVVVKAEVIELPDSK